MREIRFGDREAAGQATLALWGPDPGEGPLIDEAPEILRAQRVRLAVARTGRAKVALPDHVAITGALFVGRDNPAPLGAVTVWRIAVFVGPHFLDYALQVRNIDDAKAIRAQMLALARG
jgi:hypothetical protein